MFIITVGKNTASSFYQLAKYTKLKRHMDKEKLRVKWHEDKLQVMFGEPYLRINLEIPIPHSRRNCLRKILIRMICQVFHFIIIEMPQNQLEVKVKILTFAWGSQAKNEEQCFLSVRVGQLIALGNMMFQNAFLSNRHFSLNIKLLNFHFYVI